MKLYRHYKNKNYRLLGHVRHSETLEEMAFYECLYPNDKGKLWVRPRDLFYGNIDIDGKKVERFAPVPLKLRFVTEISSQHVEDVIQLSKEVFGNEKNKHLAASLSEKKELFLIFAEVDGKPVGYKMGYRWNADTFYSWLGGVLPSHQGLGIASDMMEAQHNWCREHGYEKVLTKTGNHFLNMMILNLKTGFNIKETVIGKDGDVRIFMEKML